MNNELETNGKGNVILRPVTGWIIAPVAEISVLLAVQYVESPEDIEIEGKWKKLQIVLMPAQALSLAEALTRAGKSLLEPPRGGQPTH